MKFWLKAFFLSGCLLFPDTVAFGAVDSGDKLAETGMPQPVPLRADENLRASIEQSFRIQYALRDVKDTTLVQVMIQVDLPPTDMAFNMSLQSGGDVWPLGPVAWGAGNIEWWAYDTDLPENIQEVDIMLTPSGSAAAQLKRKDSYQRLNKIKEIWSGQPILLHGIKIQSQEITMHKIEPPTTEEGRWYAMEQLNEAEPLVQQLKKDGDWVAARARLEEKARGHHGDARLLYDVGCIKLADGDLGGAMKTFVEVQSLNPPASLRRKAQSQLRYICAMYWEKAETDTSASCALGAAYEHGWGVKQVFQEAKRCYRNAGNAGNAEGMCRLAAMYEYETGATVHTDKARQWYRSECREWYRKAVKLGNEEARQWLSKHDQH